MGRAPLHYAAALDGVNQGTGGASGKSWYQLLTDFGAPEDVEDLVSRRFYIQYRILYKSKSGDLVLKMWRKSILLNFLELTLTHFLRAN